MLSISLLALYLSVSELSLLVHKNIILQKKERKKYQVIARIEPMTFPWLSSV
jgi:hypothetical protein